MDRRLDVQSCISANNTAGVCFDVNGGTNSFMYAESLGFAVNANAVTAGQASCSRSAHPSQWCFLCSLLQSFAS